MWACAAAGLVLVWWMLAVHFVYADNWTGLFCTGDQTPIPPELRTSTYLFPNSTGYDGQFYRYIAHDPVFTHGYAAFVDDARLRYRRILLPGAAYLLALGSARRIDAAYIGCELVAVWLGVYWCCRYVQRYGRDPAWGLLFLAVPATLGTIDRMLTDGLLTALFAGFLFYSESRERGRAYAIAALAALTRETGILIVVAAVGYRLYQRRFKDAAWFATAALPAAAWYAYVAWNTRPILVDRIFEWPGVLLIQRLFTLRPYPEFQWLFQSLDVLALLGVIGSVAVGVYLIWTERGLSETSMAALPFLFLALMLGNRAHFIEAYGYARPISPLLLFVMLRSVGRGFRLGLVPPLLTSLGIAIFLVAPARRIIQGLLFG